MAQFSYKAKNAEGRVLEGTLEAESEDQARVVLRGRRFTVLELGKSKGAKKGPKVAMSDVVIFSRQLATMQAAGLPLVQAIVLLFAVIFVVSNLLVDLSYAFFDPRIRYE